MLVHSLFAFRNTFIYTRGRINNEEEEAKAISVGTAQSPLQVTNSESTLGRVVIRHEQKNSVVSGGLFHVLVTAGVEDVSYSIVLSGNFAWPLQMEVKRRTACYLAKQREVAECKKEITMLNERLILLERKNEIEANLAQKSFQKAQKCEVDMEQLDVQLDATQDYLKDGGASIIKEINDLKLDYDKSYNLFCLR